MAADFTNTGAFNVNGQWATAVRYEVTLNQGEAQHVQLRFMNGDAELATPRVSAAQARELLGDRNYERIAGTIASRATASTGDHKPAVSGELRGASLEFREIVLPEHRAEPENAIWSDSRVRGEPKAAKDPESSPAPADVVPHVVAERFLKVDNRYYFPDRTLAFTDHGTRLKARTHNIEVIRSLVAIAQARGWATIGVSGAPEFRRQVWREATLRGLEVKGHDASDVEREELRRAMHKRPGRETSGHARPSSPDPAQAHPPSTARAGSDAEPRSDASSEDRPPLLKGRLVEAGAAHYKFDPKQSQSYYVRLQTDDGERLLWGVDLERALVESKTRARIGDVVAVESRGSQRVTVKVPRRDDTGNLVGDQPITTHRNAWVIEKPAYFEQRARMTAAFRDGAATRQEDLVAQHPDLASSVVGLWLGEQFANARIEQPADRERFVALVRNRLAQVLEHGEPIAAPMLKPEAARQLDATADDPNHIARRARTATRLRPREREAELPPHARG
jgi:hypothetical protein